MKKCPYCSEEIQDEAVKCKHCGEILSSQLRKKERRANVKKDGIFMQSMNCGCAVVIGIIILIVIMFAIAGN